MEDISLVIMAAGLASRYGGGKQVDGVGPHNEILLEYAVYDALRAGFHRVVFIIQPEMAELMDRLCGDYLRRRRTADGRAVEVAYAFQDYGSLPGFYQVPEGRTKPFGTVHALLCAEPFVHGPCCVINADDYYGIGAYRTIFEELRRLPGKGRATMVGYLLKNTASLHGTVSRGVCAVEGGWLKSVHETKKIQLYADGSLRDILTDRPLDPESPVSMNFWGFMPSIFPLMRDYFHAFLRSVAGRELQSECLLPVMVDALMREGALNVSVLHSDDRWFGMTYREDRALVSEELKKLHAAGAYPEDLRR